MLGTAAEVHEDKLLPVGHVKALVTAARAKRPKAAMVASFI